MGFEVQTAKKGSDVDGHKCDDVKEHRKSFLDVWLQSIYWGEKVLPL